MLLVTPDKDLHAIMISNDQVFNQHLRTLQNGDFQANRGIYELLLNVKYDNRSEPIDSDISSNLAAKRLNSFLDSYGLAVYKFDKAKNKWVRP